MERRKRLVEACESSIEVDSCSSGIFVAAAPDFKILFFESFAEEEDIIGLATGGNRDRVELILFALAGFRIVHLSVTGDSGRDTGNGRRESRT